MVAAVRALPPNRKGTQKVVAVREEAVVLQVTRCSRNVQGGNRHPSVAVG